MANEIAELAFSFGFVKVDEAKLNTELDKIKKGAKEAEDKYKEAAKKQEEAIRKAAEKGRISHEEAAKRIEELHAKTANKIAGVHLEAQKKIVDTQKKTWKESREAAEDEMKKQREAMTKELKHIGFAVAAVGGGFAALIKTSVESADSMAKQARSVGAAADEYQRLVFAVGRGGGKASDLNVALKFMNDQLNQAKIGGAQEFQNALELIGLSASDFGPSAEANLGLVADALDKIEDKSQRAGISVRILGEGGLKLSSFMTGGAEAIKAAGDEAERLGLVLDEKTLAEAEAFNDLMSDTTQTATALARSVALEVLPSLKEWVEDARDVTTENRKMIGSGLRDFLDGITKSVDNVADTFDVFRSVAKEVDKQLDVTATDTGDKLVTMIQLVGATIAVSLGPWTTLAAAVGAVILNLDTLQEKFEKAVDWLNPFGSMLEHQAMLEDVLHGGRSGFGGLQMVRSEKLDNVFMSGNTLAGVNQLQKLSDSDLQFFAENSQLATARQHAQEELAFRDSKKRFQTSVGSSQLSAKQAEIAARRRSGGRKEADIDLEANVFDVDDLIGDEIRRIATRDGLSDVAVDQALKAAAGPYGEGASEAVIREAALQKLGSLSGRNYLKPGGDPMLSEIFGDDVPDVALSQLARGTTPSVLNSVINNHFNLQIQQNIDGAGDTVAVARAAVNAIKTDLKDAVAKSTKTAKVTFAR